LWLGDTENKTIVTHLLADLVDRGLSAESGLPVVIDGAKALAAGVRKVFGDQVLVQRCVLRQSSPGSCLETVGPHVGRGSPLAVEGRDDVP
jgi:hypothetical protein